MAGLAMCRLATEIRGHLGESLQKLELPELRKAVGVSSGRGFFGSSCRLDPEFEGRQRFGTIGKAGGNETVQFIKTHLRFESEDPVRVSMLIRQLEDEDGGVRERSERELRGMDSQLALKRRLSDPCPTDLRLRIESVMKEMDALPIAAGKILLGLRAIHVLERIGSSEAQSLLLDIASSAPGRRSRDAFASAQRLRALSPR